MTPEEMLAALLGHPIRMDTNQGGVAVPVVQGEHRPVAQQPRATYHNIPVAVQPNGQLQRDPRAHASGRAGPNVMQSAVARALHALTIPYRLGSILAPARGPDPATAPRSVQVPR